MWTVLNTHLKSNTSITIWGHNYREQEKQNREDQPIHREKRYCRNCAGNETMKCSNDDEQDIANWKIWWT